MIEQDDVIIHFWQDIIDQAVLAKASDIHVEPENGVSHIRLRVDGRLSHLASSPAHWHDRIASRVKILARLDIAEKRLPQDGQMQVIAAHHENPVACRISTLPTIHGEKIVVRLLNQQANDLDIGKIGLTQQQLSDLLTCLNRTQGLILVTGPTGSGKTKTLYSCLKYLLDGSRNITSIEDPVEIQLKGINQVPINEKAGLRFDVALRALMRQDPDIIMVGEIRDHETAQIALQASETGHLVLATLHANDAPSTISRLQQLGCSSSQIANNVSCITAQRLVRIFCQSCNGHSSSTCDTCQGSGFDGRRAVHQVMPITESIQQMIEQGSPIAAIKAEAQTSGVLTLLQSGQLLVAKNMTSFEEVKRQLA